MKNLLVFFLVFYFSANDCDVSKNHQSFSHLKLTNKRFQFIFHRKVHFALRAHTYTRITFQNTNLLILNRKNKSFCNQSRGIGLTDPMSEILWNNDIPKCVWIFNKIAFDEFPMIMGTFLPRTKLKWFTCHSRERKTYSWKRKMKNKKKKLLFCVTPWTEDIIARKLKAIWPIKNNLFHSNDFILFQWQSGEATRKRRRRKPKYIVDDCILKFLKKVCIA